MTLPKVASKAQILDTMKDTIRRFSAAHVARRFAMEHASPEARKEYLHEHPNADPSNHTVGKKEEKGSNHALELYKHSRKAEKELKSISGWVKKINKSEDEVANADLLKKVTTAGTSILNTAVAMQKKLQGMDSKHAKREFDFLKKSIRGMEEELDKVRESSLPGHTASKIAELAEDLYGDIQRVGALAVADNL